MRLLLALVIAFAWITPASAFDSLEIPREAVRIDTLHPLPDLRAFSLVEEKDMACMQEMAITQCTRKIYGNSLQRAMLVLMAGAPIYYWYVNPATSQISSVPFEGTEEEGLLTKDKGAAQSDSPNAGDFFSTMNKQGGGSVQLFKF